MADTTEDITKKLLSGHFSTDDFPVFPAKVVRIYLSSAGNDTLTERSVLVKEAYPRLREYCRNRYRAEFQVVDLEWGYPPDQTRQEPELHEFRRNEIRKCLESGLAPSLVIFISQKYGRSPVPAVIECDEFEAIRVALHQHRSRMTRYAGLLDDWFVRDNNNLPPVYVLRPVKELIPDITNEDNEIRTLGEAAWAEKETILSWLLEKGAELSYLDGVIDSDKKLNYGMSEQERDIDYGLANCDSLSQRCLVINRNIVDLKNYINDPRAARFAEIAYNEKTEQPEFEEKCSTRLNRLSQRLRGLVSNNVLNYDILWRYEDVVHPKLHREYLESLRDEFSSSVVRMIESCMPKSRPQMTKSVESIYSHWARCKQLATNFCGQEETRRQTENYLRGRHETPLIIHGPSGSGKTTLLSKLAISTYEILGDAVLTVVRYVGMTSQDYDIIQVLQSICEQINAYLDVEVSPKPLDLQDAKKTFQQIITSFPPHLFLVVYLDDVHLMTPPYHAQQLDWLPCSLPINVKIVITTDSEVNGVLKRLQTSLVVSPDCYLDLSFVSVDQCVEMFVQSLARCERAVTMQQLDVYRQMFSRCSLPLFVQLMSQEAKHLRSYSDPREIKPEEDVLSAIHQLFERLENSHGKVFVSHAMSFLCASGSGLSDCEMDDVLSLDDDVLNAVYHDYHPEMRRIPTRMWLSLKQDLEHFLVSQNVDGITVYTWNNKMFDVVVQERHLHVNNVVKESHSILADYFLGTWANKEKPVKLPTCGLVLLPCGDKADRKVPSQPLTFQSFDGVVSFNERKYDHVPRHLVLSGRLDEMNRLVLFNYEWMYNKVKAVSLEHVLADFNLHPGPEAVLVAQALRAAEPVLNVNINNLAPEVTGHLLPYYSSHVHIRDLIKQCDTTGLQHCALVPNFAYLKIPGGPLQHTIEPPEQPECFVFSSDNRFLLTKRTDSSFVYTYDLETGRATSTVFASNGDLHVTPSGEYFVIVDHETKKSIKIHHSNSGRFVGQIIIENHLQLKPGDKCTNGPMCLTDDILCATVSTDIGYLCIADVASCQLLQILELEGKISVCVISHDSHYVICNSNDRLMAYHLDTMETLSSLPLGVKPDSIALTKDGFRCFLSNKQEGKLYNIHVDNGHFDLIYKINLEQEFLSDQIQDIKLSPCDNLILLRGNHVMIVHDRSKENICAILSRPAEIPKEFRLPKCHYSALMFTQAEFSRDGRFVIGTILRKICVWDSHTGEMVTSVDAPVGIISCLKVSYTDDKVITHSEQSAEIHVWNIGSQVNTLNTLDKLSGVVSYIQVTADGSIAYVSCKNSDEVGVIDMRSGVLLDLLTHDQNVDDFASTPSGGFLLVTMTPRLRDTATKLWDVTERRIIKEFGNTSGYCVPLNVDNDLIFVGQNNSSFMAPYYIIVFHFIGDTFIETSHQVALNNIRMKPVVTSSDRYLIILSGCSDYDHTSPTICVFDLQNKMALSCYNGKNLNLKQSMADIITVKPCSTSNNSVAVIYQCSGALETDNTGTSDSSKTFVYGLFILDVESGQISRQTNSFTCSDSEWVEDAVFASDFTFCLHKDSYIRNLSTGQCVSRLPSPDSRPQLLALNNTVVVYFRQTRLVVVRLADAVTIADCDVHGKPCCIKLCADNRTLIAGCEDGTVISYVIIDPNRDNPHQILKFVKSRQLSEVSAEDGRLSRTWDKVDAVSCPEYSRPPSVLTHKPRDMVLLIEIQPLARPRSQLDSLIYVNPKSPICSVM